MNLDKTEPVNSQSQIKQEVMSPYSSVMNIELLIESWGGSDIVFGCIAIDEFIMCQVKVPNPWSQIHSCLNMVGLQNKTNYDYSARLVLEQELGLKRRSWWQYSEFTKIYVQLSFNTYIMFVYTCICVCI